MVKKKGFEMSFGLNKKGFEMSFAWLFSIIVGAVIIFLAIYATTKLVVTEKTVQNTETAKEFGILLNPVETGLEESKLATVSFPVETVILNDCSTSGDFGRQGISATSKSNFKADSAGVESGFKNKYIFSENSVDGKDFEIFSKPFKMPFKTADVVFLIGNKKYCFVSPSTDIEEDIRALKFTGIKTADKVSECDKDSEKVCFEFSDRECDTEVYSLSKSVKKSGKTEYYDDEFDNSLLWGAIFASPEIYECQVQRLMKRTGEISLVYLGKTEYLTAKGCSSNLEEGLNGLEDATKKFKNSFDLRAVSPIASELERRNNGLTCKLF